MCMRCGPFAPLNSMSNVICEYMRIHDCMMSMYVCLYVCRHTCQHLEDGEASLRRAASLCLLLFLCLLSLCLCLRVVLCVMLCCVVCCCGRGGRGCRCGGGGGGEREKERDQSIHLVADSRQSFPQDNWSSTASSGEANDWRNAVHPVW